MLDRWPFDDDHVVQVDGDHLLDGAVRPGIEVALTRGAVESINLDDDDVVLDAAVTWLNSRQIQSGPWRSALG